MVVSKKALEDFSIGPLTSQVLKTQRECLELLSEPMGERQENDDGGSCKTDGQ